MYLNASQTRDSPMVFWHFRNIIQSIYINVRTDQIEHMAAAIASGRKRSEHASDGKEK